MSFFLPESQLEWLKHKNPFPQLVRYSAQKKNEVMQAFQNSQMELEALLAPLPWLDTIKETD